MKIILIYLDWHSFGSIKLQCFIKDEIVVKWMSMLMYWCDGITKKKNLSTRKGNVNKQENTDECEYR